MALPLARLSGSAAADRVRRNQLQHVASPRRLLRGRRRATLRSPRRSRRMCSKHLFNAWGAGGAGGSGRRGAATTVRQGGTGGGGGNFLSRQVPDSYVTTSIVFTVPAGPAGGTAISANDTNGNPGSTAAGNTIVAFSGSNVVGAGAGGPGAGGQAATALSGGAGGGSAAGAAGGTSVSQGGAPKIDVASVTEGQIGGGNGQLGAIGTAVRPGRRVGPGVTNAATATGPAGGAATFGSAGGGSGGGISAANAAQAGEMAQAAAASPMHLPGAPQEPVVWLVAQLQLLPLARRPG